jgi:hypothetical protein
MQFNPVYLYSNKVDVFTNLNSWTTERYRQVYQRNFKIYRGVDNKLDLQVRNGDEKARDITGYTLVFNLVERETQKLLVSKECSVVSAVNGTFTVSLTETDLVTVNQGSYSFTIYYISPTGVKKPFYIDSQYGATGTIEVYGDITGETIESTVIDTFESIPTYWPNDGTSKSELVYASPSVSSTKTIHTFAVYQTNYTGTVNIEGSLEPSATPRSGVWTTLATIQYPSDIRYKNIEGKWNWFRIKHTPSVGQFTITPIQGNTYRVQLDKGGKGYVVNEQFIIKGTKLGGSDSVHDLVITVTSVDNIGAIVSFTFTGVSNYLTNEQTKIISLGTIDKVLYR